MSRVAPSQRVREEINRVLRTGVDGKMDVKSTLLRLGAQRLAQELLEEEVTDFLGRERYVRHRGARPHRGYRNGYEPSRIRSAEGEIPLQVPQVRATPEPFQPTGPTYPLDSAVGLPAPAAALQARDP